MEIGKTIDLKVQRMQKISNEITSEPDNSKAKRLQYQNDRNNEPKLPQEMNDLVPKKQTTQYPKTFNQWR